MLNRPNKLRQTDKMLPEPTPKQVFNMDQTASPSNL